MKVLLDTHCFLWAAFSPEKLSGKSRKILSDPATEVHVSTVTFWEISLKFAMGKLRLSGFEPDDLVATAFDLGFSVVAPTADESASFHRLPRRAHKDPFDRMLIWQCLRRDWTFVSRDGGVEDYRADGLKILW